MLGREGAEEGLERNFLNAAVLFEFGRGVGALLLHVGFGLEVLGGFGCEFLFHGVPFRVAGAGLRLVGWNRLLLEPSSLRGCRW